jgi:hypothetical protein
MHGVAFRSKQDTPTAVLAVPGEGKHWQSLEGDFTVCEDQEFVGRLLAMCTVESSSGLSQVYNTILKPNKANFYQTPPAGAHKSGFEQLVGANFDQLQGFFPRSIVCGIVRDGAVMLAPGANLKLLPTDSILVFANEKGQVAASRVADKAGASPAEGEVGQCVSTPSHVWCSCHVSAVRRLRESLACMCPCCCV